MKFSILNEADLARNWLISHAFPLWFKKGFDASRGFADVLDFDTGQDASKNLRLRVLARQIYVFCQASRLGFESGRIAVESGVNLLTRCELPTGGFASVLDFTGSPTNNDQDTYDLAFVLFALAHAFALLRSDTLRDQAVQLCAFIENSLRHPHGGFVEGKPTRLPRRQNPHMHLLEACLAWLPFDANGTFRRIADEIVLLLERRFFDAQTGAIYEYFDDSLRIDESAQSAIIEPGHLYEWYWLLNQYTHATKRTVSIADRIYDFARKYGCHNGMLFGELTRSGVMRTNSVRLWPHAEWIRAELVHISKGNDQDLESLQSALSAFWRFLNVPMSGLWFERYDGHKNVFLAQPVPASSLYHIVGAFSALIRSAEGASLFEI
jgi:mannose/cellobiose epimerase-like protein (N-acyl-D-glucosamine 2-epimerase family)